MFHLLLSVYAGETELTQRRQNHSGDIDKETDSRAVVDDGRFAHIELLDDGKRRPGVGARSAVGHHNGRCRVLAKQTGGEAVQVSRTSDYARGLSKIIGNLTARYSLGFTLAEEEKDDGRLHALELRVKAPDAKGKLRKLEVSSRQGYYMATATEKATTTSRAQ